MSFGQISVASFAYLAVAVGSATPPPSVALPALLLVCSLVHVV